MATTSPVESVKTPEDQLFNHEAAIKQLSIDSVAEPATYEITNPTLEKVEGGNDKNEKSKFRIRLMKIGAAVVLAISLVAGGALLGSNLNHKGNNDGETGLGGGDPTEDLSSMGTSGDEETTVNPDSLAVTVAPSETVKQTTASETTVETNTSAQVDYSMPPTDVAEGYSFDSALNAEQQIEIKKVNAMNSEISQTLPTDEQLAFATWIFDNNRPNFELVMGKNDINLKYIDNPTTAEEIIGNYAYLSSFQVSLFEYSADKGMAYDLDSTKKLNVLKMTPTEVHTKGQNAYMDSFANSIPTVFDYNMTVEGYKKTEDGFIINVYEQSTKNITVNPGEEHNQLTFVYTKVIDIQGNERGWYICSLNIPASDPGYIENLTNN